MMAECFISIAHFPKKGPCAVPGVTVTAEQACAEAMGRSITNALLPVSQLTGVDIKQFRVLKQSHVSAEPHVSTPCHCFLRLQLPTALDFDGKRPCLLLTKIRICWASL